MENDWPENRPAVWLKLFRQSGLGGELEEVSEARLKPVSSWMETITWTDIAMISPEGQDYIFSVKQVDQWGQYYTPTGYQKLENGLRIVNNYSPNPIDVSFQIRPQDIIGNQLKIEECDFILLDENNQMISRGVRRGPNLMTFNSSHYSKIGNYPLVIQVSHLYNKTILVKQSLIMTISVQDGIFYATTSI